MANKAVLGGLVLAGGAIGVMHKVNQWRHEREQDSAKIEEERKNAELEAFAEKMSRSSKDEFQHSNRVGGIYLLAFRQLAQMQLNLLRELIPLCKAASSSQSFELPLVRTREPKPPEVLLAVGLGLCNDEADVERLLGFLEDQEIATSLGTAVSSISIVGLGRVHAKLAATAACLPICGDVPVAALPSSVWESLQSILVQCKPGEPLLRFVDVPGDTSLVQLDQVLHLLNLCGNRWDQVDVDTHTHSDRAICTSGSATLANSSARLSGGDVKLVIANFSLRSFVLLMKIDGNRAVFQPVGARPTVTKRNGTLAPVLPPSSVLPSLIASIMFTRLVEALRLRYAKLLDSLPADSYVSLEHLVACASNLTVLELRPLRSLRQQDAAMLRKLSTSTSQKLEEALLKSAPAPRGPHAESTLRIEVRHFVRDYLALVQIRLQCVPVLIDGRKPTDVLERTSVWSELKRPGTVSTILRMKQLLHEDERERSKAVREFASLPAAFEAAGSVVLLLLLLLMAWLTFVPMPGLLRVVLRPMGYAWIVAPGPCMWVLYALSLVAGRSELIAAQHLMQPMLGCERPTDVWREVLLGSYSRLAALNRWEQPVDRTLRALELGCTTTTEIWAGRLAEREFAEALLRRRIGHSAALQLLQDLGSARQARSTRRRSMPKHSRAWRRARQFQNLFFARFPSRTSTPSARAEAEKAEAEEAAAEAEAEAADEAEGELHEGEEGGVLPSGLEDAEAFLEMECHDETPAELPQRSALAAAFASAGLAAAPARLTFQPAAASASASDDQHGAGASRANEGSHSGAASSAQRGGVGSRGSRTVEQRLRLDGWSFVRKRSHIVFKRLVSSGRQQTFVQAATPSCPRSHLNQLRDLDHLDAERAELERESRQQAQPQQQAPAPKPQAPAPTPQAPPPKPQALPPKPQAPPPQQMEDPQQAQARRKKRNAKQRAGTAW